MEPVQIHNGLEGITVAATELSHIDGERGVLILRGHSVDRLAPEATFEDVAYLLWHGSLPNASERAELAAQLYAGRAKAFERLADARPALAAQDAMDALRGATALLTERDSADLPGLLTGALAVFAAAHARIRAGREPIAPRKDHSHAADYLAMLSGTEPSPALVRALD
ncbi:MAG TPA: citrate/2-methylcitrate synthase, partial [Polyangiales bacterium]|nr:citrate/2-methylcitrate synthase [Polyangiales bacterium]